MAGDSFFLVIEKIRNKEKAASHIPVVVIISSWIL
jgi:hypothetical protein